MDAVLPGHGGPAQWQSTYMPTPPCALALKGAADREGIPVTEALHQIAIAPPRPAPPQPAAGCFLLARGRHHRHTPAFAAASGSRPQRAGRGGQRPGRRPGLLPVVLCRLSRGKATASGTNEPAS